MNPNIVHQRQLLEAELAQLESAIEELAQKRVQLKQQINQCCPISKLHPEILLQIFVAIFPENSFSSWGSDTPLLLGAICHGWRELAWSFPRLWSSVSFVVKHYTTTKNNLLRQWLARSRNLPLSIQFNMRKPRVVPKERHTIWESMDIIARCSEQWQHVDLRLLVMFHSSVCFSPTQFPLLVSMSIYQVPTEIYYQFTDIYSRFFHWKAPKLQNVYFDSIIENCVIFPMDNIVRLSRREGAFRNDFLDTLRAAPNLVQCKFQIEDEIDWESPPSSIVTALNLEKLEISCVTDFPGLFDYFAMPAARELSVDYLDGGFQYEAFISLLSRSGCHLTRLSLTGLTASTGLAECFQATPSLTELHLGIVTMNTAFRILTVDQSLHKAILPNLESFIYTHVNGYMEDMGANPDLSTLAVMARSRWDHSSQISASFEVAQLKSIYMEILYYYLDEDEEDSGDEDDDEESEEVAEDEAFSEIRPLLTAYERPVMEGFQRLVAEGMNVNIQSVAKRRRPNYQPPE